MVTLVILCVCACMLQEHLLSEGYVEQCPLEFLLSSDPGTKMVVLVHNKYIEEHIHEVGLQRKLPSSKPTHTLLLSLI